MRDAIERFAADSRPAALIAEDDKFWAEVRAQFVLRGDVLNLDHGWTNPTTRATSAS